jgi:hypothetical protein
MSKEYLSNRDFRELRAAAERKFLREADMLQETKANRIEAEWTGNNKAWKQTDPKRKKPSKR